MKYTFKLIVLVLIINSLDSYSQSKLSLLQNKDWVYQKPTTYVFSLDGASETPSDTTVCKIKFTKTKFQRFKNNNFESKLNYYLSDDFVHWNKFDEAKVGDGNNGEFLITSDKTYFIKELIDGKLVIVPYFYLDGNLLLSTQESTFLTD